MQSRIHNFAFSPNSNFATDNLFIVQNQDESKPFPPTPGSFELLNGSIMLLLNGGEFNLL